MLFKISPVLFFFFILHSGYSQIINLSNNNTSSSNPKFFYHNGKRVALWNDGIDLRKNIYIRFSSNNQWSNTQIIETSGNALTLAVFPDPATGIHLAWIEIDSGLSRLMYGRIIDSTMVDSEEIAPPINAANWSASLFIDDPNTIHLCWEEGDWDTSKVYYRYCDFNGNWSAPQLLHISANYFPLCKPQLIKDKNDELFCFWLDTDSTGIDYIKQIDLNNWGPVQYLPPSPSIELGADFIVKADDSLNIHLVSNHTYITTFSNSLFYTCWNGANWQNIVSVPIENLGFGPLIESYRPEMTFSAEGYPIITWDQQGYNYNFDPGKNGIGTSIKLNTGWHVNRYIALYRAPRYSKILADENNVLHYIWQDTTDGDLDIYYTNTDFLTTISDRTDPRSSDFHLFQNYPNPFNPSTEIQYSIPKSQFVTIEVYSILGQRIRKLLSQKQLVGEHSVVWNGRDDLGNKAASGIYLYQLKAGEHMDVKKMILLK